MKKKLILCILLIILFFASAFSQDSTSTSNNDKINRVGFYPGVISGFYVGSGHVEKSEKYFKEKFLTLHMGAYILEPSETMIGGIFYRTNYYMTKTRDGFFFDTTVGLDLFKMPGLPLDPGGAHSSNSSFTFISPNLRGGMGYAIRTNNGNKIELNFEVGITLVIASLNISYVF